MRKAWSIGAAIAALGLSVGLLDARAQDSGDVPSPAPSDAAPAATDGPPARAPLPAPTVRAIPAPAPPLPPPPPQGRLAPGAPIPPAELEAFVDGAVLRSMQRDHIPAVAVSVVQNGQVLLKKAYGFASYAPAQPADPDATLFRLGALSASFTWLAALREVERGHMRLDGPVNLYLPEKLQVHDQGFADPVRLRDLMAHASGFEDRALGRLYERDPGRVRPLETYLRQESPRRALPPGLRSEFTDYDAALAGEAVSQAAGQPFDAMMEQTLFRPLGMTRTSFREPHPASPYLPEALSPDLARNLAQDYRWTGSALEPRPFAYASQIAPAASAASTAGDMARYMSVLLAGGVLDGQTLFGPATAQALRTIALIPAPGAPGWTYGLQQQPLPGGVEGVGLAGPGLSSHADMTLAPSLGLGVFVAGNSDTASALVASLPAQIVDYFYAPPAGPPPEGVQDARALGDAFAGHYLSERRRRGGLEMFVDLLTHTATVRARPDGLLAIDSPEGSGVWAPFGAAGHFVLLGQAPAASTFELANGRAVRWFAPSGLQSFERVGLLRRPAGLFAATLLALTASIAVLLGLAVRDRRDFRQTTMQRRASALQTTASILWLLSACVAAVGLKGVTGEEAGAQFDWPGVLVVIGSACALVAALASVGQLLTLPAVWRGGRRLDSWTSGRKLTFTVTVAVFIGFSALLAYWGALEPWNS